MGRSARFWEVLGLRLKAPGDRSPTCAVHILICRTGVQNAPLFHHERCRCNGRIYSSHAPPPNQAAIAPMIRAMAQASARRETVFACGPFRSPRARGIGGNPLG